MRRVATWATASVLLLLAVGLAVAPREVPGVVIPGHPERSLDDDALALPR